MDVGSLISSAIILSSGGLIAYLLRDVPQRIFKWGQKKMLYTVSIYQNDELFDVLEDWFFKNYLNHYRDVEASIGYNDMPMTVTGDTPIRKELKFKQEENFFVATHDGRSIYISKTKEKIDKAVSLRDIYYRKYILRGFRAKQQINDLLQIIVADYNKKKEKGLLKVYANNSWGDWTCINDIIVKPFDKIVMQDKQLLVDDIDEFVSMQDWYRERGIRHKRCYLLHGCPGNGKTTIAMAIGEKLNRDVYVLNLNSLETDSHLIRAFSQLGKSIILLIEDVDRAFSKRDNVDSRISFSSLLNSLDGALCKDGIITAITTNHIDQLDEALIRDGRVDVKFEIKNPSASQVKEYIELFYGIKIHNEIQSNDCSMSSLQELCIKNIENSLAIINQFAIKDVSAVHCR